MDLSKISYCWIFHLFLKISSSLCNFSFTKVFSNKALDDDHSLFILNNLTEWQCLFEASNEPRSGSVSYHMERKICVVNAVFNDEEIELKMKEKQGWTSFKKEEKQVN